MHECGPLMIFGGTLARSEDQGREEHVRLRIGKNGARMVGITLRSRFILSNVAASITQKKFASQQSPRMIIHI